MERLARRAVPGGGALRVMPLSAGPLHDTFRVERDGRAFSMRVAVAPPRGWPPRGWPPRGSTHAALQDAAWLLSVVQRAADQALAPPLVYGDAARGITVHEWVEGCVWPAAATRRARSIDRVAALMRRVHALAPPAAVPPALPRAATPTSWVRHYRAALLEQQRGARRKPQLATQALELAADEQLRRLEALPAVTGVVCHSDLHRLNLLEYRPPTAKASTLLLLDWEYAHICEPYWDVAGWSANNDYPDALQRRLLAAYLERAPDEAEWARCRLMTWLYDYVCLQWTELYLNSRRAAGATGLAPRATLLQARLIAGIGATQSM